MDCTLIATPDRRTWPKLLAVRPLALLVDGVSGLWTGFRVEAAGLVL
ncbi:MAG TPA: hypothetical protein VIJ96_14745 [Acidothermaceae bacterium]